jgi:tetratricopeptide (TPR) repeat protein
MKRCPFLVAGVSMQSAESRPDVNSVESLKSQECLGEPCRFFHDNGCRFDSMFEGQAQLHVAAKAAADAAQAAAQAAVLQASSVGAAAGGEAAPLLAAVPGTLEEVWSLQRESLREVLSGFRSLEAGLESQGKSVGAQIDTLRSQIAEVETQVKTAAEAKPGVGPELLDLVGRHFETLMRDIRQVETTMRSGLGDSLRTFMKESQATTLTGAEASLRAVLEGVQTTVRTTSQELQNSLRSLVADSQSALHTALVESQTTLKSLSESQGTLQASMRQSQDALRSTMQDSQKAMRTVVQESHSVVDTAVEHSQQAVLGVLADWQKRFDVLLTRSIEDSRAQVDQALSKIVDELAMTRDTRIQIQAALDGLTRESRDVATVARRVESSQVLTHELLDEQRQVHQKVKARETRDRARQLNNAGVLSYHQGAYDTSVSRFREATELDPTLAEAFNNLGLSYTEMGREEEAVVAFQRAIELDPSSGQVYNNLGYLYYRKGDLTQAIEMYQRAIQRGSDTSAAYCNLANAYYRLRRVDQAVQSWRRALEIDPSNAKAVTALERLGLDAQLH